MISYSFSDNPKTPLYEQLYQFIKKDILAGRLEGDTRLPSKRSLAEQLSVSVITVENAYSQLLSEGYIYSKPRSGFFVSDITPMNPTELPGTSSLLSSDKSSNSENAISTHLYDSKNTSVKPIIKTPATPFADFTSNANEPSSFPFATWAKLNRRILSENQELLMSNSPSNGLSELRYAIATFLWGFRGININPENIIIGAGTETIYSILIQLLGYDKVYATEDPGYDKIALTLEANNVRTVRIPLDGSGIITSNLDKLNVDVVHTTPSHHFPTGITMPIKRRYELLNWANTSPQSNVTIPGEISHSQKQYHRYIIEDDYDSEFRLSGLPIPSLMSIDTNEHVIYMNTFTKTLASTIRISYMILPDHLMQLYHEKLSFYSCPVSTFEQLTLAHFISEGYFEKHINRSRTASRKKRDLLLKSIKNGPLADISEISEEQSGLHFILKINTPKKTKEIQEAAEKTGIRISFVKSRDKTKNLMINYSSIPLDRIEEAVTRLEKIFIL